MLMVTKKDFWDLVDRNLDVAKWMLNIAYGELWYLEHINSNVRNGSAVQRFLALWNQRPEIIRRVPQRIIASYLEITPEYLSRIKRDVIRGKIK